MPLAVVFAPPGGVGSHAIVQGQPYLIMSINDKSNKKTREILLKKYNSKCAYCGHEISIKTMQVDHIIPLYKKLHYDNSLNHFENYNPSCGSCNSSKSTFTLDEWRNQLVLKINRIKRDSSTFRILERFGVVGIIKSDVTFYFEIHNG